MYRFVVPVMLISALAACMPEPTHRAAVDDEATRAAEARRLEEFQELLARAHDGEVEAQHMVGLELQSGRTVRKSNHDAIDWFETAAHQGHVASQLHLAKLYEAGRGTYQSHGLAAYWYGKAKEAGDASAGQLVYGIDDAPLISEIYLDNKLRFERTYVGKYFATKLPFRAAKSSWEFRTGSYQIQFGTEGFTSDVDCITTNEHKLDEVASWDKSQIVEVAGLIDSVLFDSIQLKSCFMRKVLN